MPTDPVDLTKSKRLPRQWRRLRAAVQAEARSARLFQAEGKRVKDYQFAMDAMIRANCYERVLRIMRELANAD